MAAQAGAPRASLTGSKRHAGRSITWFLSCSGSRRVGGCVLFTYSLCCLSQQGSPLLPACRHALCPAGGSATQGSGRSLQPREQAALGLHNSALLFTGEASRLSFLCEVLTPLFIFRFNNNKFPTDVFSLLNWFSPCSCCSGGWARSGLLVLPPGDSREPLRSPFRRLLSR